MPLNKKKSVLTKGLFVAYLFSHSAHGTNGTNALALSPEAFAVGGADIGFIRDTAAVAVNPANLNQIDSGRVDLGFGYTDADSVRHADIFNNFQYQQNSPIPFGSFGYAKRTSSNLVVGIAFVGQGGVGIEYKDLNTAFGTQDKLENTLRIGKLSFGGSYQLKDSLALGMSAELVYSDLEQSFFPNTSVADPGNQFFGYKIDKANTISAGFRFSLSYQVNRRIKIGVAYVTPSDLDFDDTRYVSDMSSVGLGKVEYEADIENQKQPKEFGVGLVFQATDKLTLTSEINWINWSDAFDTPRLIATKPNNSLAPERIETELIQQWDDQYVYSLGAVYTANEALTLRGGVNYAENPIPEGNQLPLFPLIGERHAAIGLGYKLSRGWQLDGAFIRTIPHSVTYTNRNAPFGPNAEEKLSLWHAFGSVSYLW